MNIIKKANWAKLIILTIILSLGATVATAATSDNQFKFTVSSPKSGETLIKEDTEDIIWTITGTENNLESLIAQDRISRVYLMEKVYKKSGATTIKTAKLLKDISLDGEIECNDAHTVCSLNQNYDWTISSKFKTGSKYFIRVYLRPQPNLFSGLAKFFTLNNRYVFNDTDIFTIKAKNETVTITPSATTQTACLPKLKYIQTNDSTQSCCSGLKACKLTNSTQAICLSDCDATTVKSETSLLSSTIKITGEVDTANPMAAYPSSLIPDSQTEGASFEHPNFQISKNTDGTYKIHWFNGAFGPSNVVQTLIKDQTGKIVFDSNKVRLPDSGFADFDVTLDGRQKYTIVLDKVFGSDKNIEYTFDSSLINGGTKITNNVLNKSFTTTNSYFSFLNTAVSADGKSFGIDFDLKDIYGLNATRPVRKIVVTLSDGTKQTLNIDDNFLAQQNKGMVLPITGTDKTFQIDLYDINGNKIESKTLGIASNQNITLVTDYKGATGWKSVYDPSISLSSTGMYGTTSWKKYTINYDAAGASKIVLTDADGIIISSTTGSSMTLTDKQMLASHGYYLNFYDGSGKLAHTEYIDVDSKSNFTNTSLTDPSIYFTACGGGRYYLPYNLINPAKGTNGSTPIFSFVGEGGANTITYNKDGYIDVGQIKPGQQFTMTYTDPVDGKIHIYTVTVTSDKLSNGGFRLSYVENSIAIVAALSCAKQSKVCLDTSSCKAGSAVGKLDCDGNKVCCTDKCESPKVSCNGECVETTIFTTENNCGSCGTKCDLSKSEKCTLGADNKYTCVLTTIVKDTCDGICQNKVCNSETQTTGNGNCNSKDNSNCCKAKTATEIPKIFCMIGNSKYNNGDTLGCKVGLCDGLQVCQNGTWGACRKNADNCDPATGKFTQPGDSSGSTCVGDKGTCQSTGCNFVTQSYGSGTCTNLDTPYCCKNISTTPIDQSPNCYTGSFKCGTSCCSLVSEDCVNNKCVAKDNGCTHCGTANCGECSSAVNGSRCVCSGTQGTGYAYCQGSPDASCTTNQNPCLAGTISCGNDCCTANEDCVAGQCQLRENGCTSCNTAACGECSSMNNGYRCSCTGTKGNGFAVCSGGTEKDPTCPGYCAVGTTLCGTNCCVIGYKCVSNKCVTNGTPVPGASIINLFSNLRQRIINLFK
jgi:hypothetical protein